MYHLGIQVMHLNDSSRRCRLWYIEVNPLWWIVGAL